MSFVLAAQDASGPKAPGSGLLEAVPVVQVPGAESEDAGVRRIPEVDPGTLTGHQAASDGAPMLVLRYAWAGASNVRLRFSRFHLPEGAVVYVYGVGADGAPSDVKSYSGSGPSPWGDFWTDSVTGEQIVVEAAWRDEVPADLPFEVAEIANETAAAEPGAPGPGEQRAGIYRGNDVTYEIHDGVAIFENDIVLGSSEDMERAESGGKEVERYGLGITGARYRWPSGRIPYVIDSSVPTPSRVTEAIAHWNNSLGGVIRMAPRSSETDYVLFMRSGSCSSSIGMVGGAQRVYVSDWCTKGNLIHEIGHAVGLWHEQSRADRNSYVRILWDRIQTGAASNFGQVTSITDDLGTYDFNSIMHYPGTAFSLSSLPTIETIPAGIPIGQRNGLSAGDINAVRRLYGAATVPVPAPAPAPTPAPAPAPVPATQTVAVTISTNPAGQQVKVDGTVYAAPRTFSWTAGTQHTVEAVNPAASGGVQTRWVNWSNGQAQTHTITAGTSVTALLASYAVSYQVTATASPASAGTVTVNPGSSSRMYASGSGVSLTALPAAGYCFASWSGLLAGTPASASLTVNRAYMIQANFQTGAFTLSQSSRIIPAAGGTFQLGVSGSTNCAWTAKEGSTWVSISSGLTGKGSGVVTYNVSPNTTGMPRLTILMVGGQTLVIFQAGQ